MIGSLLHLTATRPDIQFSVYLCARFHASSRTSLRQAVKRIFRYIQYTPELSFWYSAPSSLLLLGFWMPILQDVESIRNQLRVLASFLVPHLFLGLLANSLV
jgi:hypothetical protein